MAIDFTRNLLVGITTEAAYNTFITTNEEGFRFLPGARFTTEQDVRVEHSARGQAAESPNDVAQGLRRWTFSGTMSVPKEALGFVWARLFGATVTSTITGYYKHVFNVNDPALGTTPTPASLSLRIIDDNKQWELSGGVVTSMTVTMNLDNFWQVSIEMMGGSYADNTIGALPTYTVPAAGRHFLTSDDFTFEVNSVAWLPNTFEITFTRMYADGVAESYAAGGATDAAGRERVRLESAGSPAFEVTGTCSRLYDGVVEFDLFDGFSEFDVSCTTRVTAGEDMQVIDGDGYAMEITLAKCRMESWDKEDSSGLTMQKLAFRAYYTAAADIQLITQDKVDGTATGIPDEGTP